MQRKPRNTLDMTPTILQYGLWESPVTLDSICRESSSGSVRVDETSGSVYGLRSDPDDRTKIISIGKPSTDSSGILPAPYSVGTRVYEYGGGAFAISKKDGNIVFSDGPSNAVCVLDPRTSTVWRIIEDPHLRFADFDVHPSSSHLVIAIQENQKRPILEHPKHSLALIDTHEKRVISLDESEDFYSQMRFSPDGHHISWLSWNYPHMPFTGAVLYKATFDGDKITQKTRIAGEPGARGISQPRWSSDGTLYYLDDISGFWQLWASDSAQRRPVPINIRGLEACDFGNAEFSLGSCSYQFLRNDVIVCAITIHAVSQVVIIDLKSKTANQLELPLMHVITDGVRRVNDQQFVLVGSTPSTPTSVFSVSIEQEGFHWKQDQSLPTVALSSGLISKSQPISFPRTHGPDQSGLGHGFLLLPRNPAYKAPLDEKPPLLVWAHGGPTNHFNPGFSLQQQYWTSRGYAILLLNYAGSTGYGRSYRRLLDRHWGVIDSADAASAASYLASANLVNPKRIGIVGPSAGGYLVLKTACDFPHLWAAGVSVFGISDTKRFAETTHKFESGYAEQLLPVKLSGPDEEHYQVHHDRSPVAHVDCIEAPILLLQGTEDRVVISEQSVIMHNALTQQHKVSELLLLRGEGHSYWAGQALRRSVTAQERWWRKYLLGVKPVP
ncbi:aminopeptidase C [Aspergillus affinis]|uniref:aminopeptidase C n=1 Tax=Aspergillus affinis TaxID=1070780 RepID=UPI0022FEB801|nr:aminopeptidase C [Aspergillus affinis]KAI9042081.1 aminopeptidase C [Aspergillus affinis]